ncbi:MAG: hypothetical protein MJ252_05195 [archaeon]|nr:hypothetical protein [archaeon]
MGCKCIMPKGDQEIDSSNLQLLSKNKNLFYLFFLLYFIHPFRQND